jgi:hypothetical protein
MPTRKPRTEHADIRRPTDRRMRLTQLTRLSVWLIFDGDTTPFCEVHLNERGSRSRSPRLLEALALLVLSGETFDFVEAVARLGSLNVTGPDVLPTLIERAQELVARKEGFTL